MTDETSNDPIAAPVANGGCFYQEYRPSRRERFWRKMGFRYQGAGGETLMTWQPDICVYHAHCDDGFGAAWAIWKRWPECRFVPGFYGKLLPIIDMADKNVLFVDFSTKRPEIDALAQVTESIVIIDHHKTAEAELEPFKVTRGTLWFDPSSIDEAFYKMAELDRPPILAWFDMNQSGAVMAWKFAQPGRNVPEFLRYIEDRDLWHFTRGDATRQFSAALKCYDQNFDVWDKLADPGETAKLVQEGAGILRAHRANLKNILNDSYMTEIAGHHVPTVNIHGLFASDIGNLLLTKYPDAPFSATWSRDKNGAVKYSLRSEDLRMDVSAIAASFGGGGHRNAAGFSVPDEFDMVPIA